MINKTGKAYAFFDCRESKERIKTELPHIRDAVGTPRELELSLMENSGQIDGDEKLQILIRETQEANVKYLMEAIYPNATNQKTADELSAVLNQAYQSELYQRDEEFCGWIFYEDMGQYVQRE